LDTHYRTIQPTHPRSITWTHTTEQYSQHIHVV